MKGSQGTGWRCQERPGRALPALDARLAESVVLVPCATRLPPGVLDRLRVAAPQLGLRQPEITAAAPDLFLSEEGF
jgi:hypothetical protein